MDWAHGGRCRREVRSRLELADPTYDALYKLGNIGSGFRDVTSIGEKQLQAISGQGGTLPLSCAGMW